jgi:hypothetical protein
MSASPALVLLLLPPALLLHAVGEKWGRGERLVWGSGLSLLPRRPPPEAELVRSPPLAALAALAALFLALAALVSLALCLASGDAEAEAQTLALAAGAELAAAFALLGLGGVPGAVFFAARIRALGLAAPLALILAGGGILLAPVGDEAGLSLLGARFAAALAVFTAALAAPALPQAAPLALSLEQEVAGFGLLLTGLACLLPLPGASPGVGWGEGMLFALTLLLLQFALGVLRGLRPPLIARARRGPARAAIAFAAAAALFRVFGA